MVKLDKNEVKAIREILEQNRYTHQEIANMFGVTRGHITKIKNKKRWNTIYGQENKS
jgi:DNA invertase Pin-like site-specific DNA recombinase